MYHEKHTQPGVNFFGQSSRLSAPSNGNGKNKPAAVKPTRRTMETASLPGNGGWGYNAFGKGNWKSEEGMLFSDF